MFLLWRPILEWLTGAFELQGRIQALRELLRTLVSRNTDALILKQPLPQYTFGYLPLYDKPPLLLPSLRREILNLASKLVQAQECAKRLEADPSRREVFRDYASLLADSLDHSVLSALAYRKSRGSGQTLTRTPET